MSFFAFLILIIIFFAFRSTIVTVKKDAETAIQHGGKALVAGAVHLRSQIPAISDKELELLAHQELQLKKLEALSTMSEEELLAHFKADAKAKAKK